MRKILLLLLPLYLVCTSCRVEEFTNQGDLIVTSNDDLVNGVPIDDIEVGLFDLHFWDKSINNLQPEEAIGVEVFRGRELTFENVNAGTYFIGVLARGEVNAKVRKVVQVKAEQTTTVQIPL